MRDVIYVKRDLVYSINQQLNETILRKSYFLKLPVPGRPTNLDYSRARAYCACSRCGWGLFGHFFSHL